MKYFLLIIIGFVFLYFLSTIGKEDKANKPIKETNNAVKKADDNAVKKADDNPIRIRIIKEDNSEDWHRGAKIYYSLRYDIVVNRYIDCNEWAAILTYLYNDQEKIKFRQKCVSIYLGSKDRYYGIINVLDNDTTTSYIAGFTRTGLKKIMPKVDNFIKNINGDIIGKWLYQGDAKMTVITKEQNIYYRYILGEYIKNFSESRLILITKNVNGVKRYIGKEYGDSEYYVINDKGVMDVYVLDDKTKKPRLLDPNGYSYRLFGELENEVLASN